MTSDVDAPRVEYEQARALVSARFPDFGHYHVARLLDEQGSDGPIVGDAIDDLADIYIDLKDAAWMWDEVDPADGAFELQSSFHTHWQWHLRDVQSYLQVRQNPR